MLGHATNTIDQKGRISIPAKMRSKLGPDFVASRGLGDCLTLYPADEWAKLMEEISTLPEEEREIVEDFYCYNASTMNLDNQGRLLMNAELRDEVHLSNEAEAIIIGRYSKIEIWNKSLYEERRRIASADKVREIRKKHNI